MCANGVNDKFRRGDKIFQRGPNISSKSGPGGPNISLQGATPFFSQFSCFCIDITSFCVCIL